MKPKLAMKDFVLASQMVSLSRGLYAHAARRMHCDASYVGRIARGERRSVKIEAALVDECRMAPRKVIWREFWECDAPRNPRILLRGTIGDASLAHLFTFSH